MATIYYKTSKNSPVGVKLQSLKDQGKKIESEIYDYMYEIGAGREYLMRGRCVFGTGVCGAKFLEQPNMKVWKNFSGHDNYYRPRLSSKIGKEIEEKFKSFHMIDRDEIAETFGFESFGNNPGFFDSGKSEYFGIAMDSKWKFEMPEDFEEITFTEYEKL